MLLKIQNLTTKLVGSDIANDGGWSLWRPFSSNFLSRFFKSFQVKIPEKSQNIENKN